MFDKARTLISSAWADPAVATADAAPPPVAGPDIWGPQALVFLVIFGFLYLLLIRPQQQKFDQHTKMLKALQKGDRVVTAGGIIATIVKIDGDDEVTADIADNVRVKLVRSTITGLATKTDAVVAEKK